MKLKYTKDLLKYLFIMIIAMIFIPFVQIGLNLREVWESSRYFRNCHDLYKKLISDFKEYKENDFDMVKVNEARRKEFIDSQFSQAQIIED